MKLEEFEKIKDEYIKNRKRVKGYLKIEDIKKADFNGVYVVLNENDEVVYIGSAYTNRFTIKNRLTIHLNGDKSNATYSKLLNKKRENISRECKEKDFRI